MPGGSGPRRNPDGEEREGEELSLERAEQLARDLRVDPQAIRRLLERALRAVWHAGPRKLVFEFPER